MRLTPTQAQAIRQRIHTHMGQYARIWLFGSRVDDSRRGGDVDLYVEPETAPDLTARLRCKSELADALDLDIDLIVQQPGQGLRRQYTPDAPPSLRSVAPRPNARLAT